MSLEFTGKHLAFLADETKEIDLEGGRMSGKSWVCSAKVIQSCLKYPGIEWLICRYSGTETDEQLRPLFLKVARRMDVNLKWDDDESAYLFPAVGGLISIVYAHGLKTQSIKEKMAKVRGSGAAGVWNDQTEETPQEIAEELRFYLRQEGYPHQLLFSPNPPDEEHFLSDQFPDTKDLPGRKYMRLSLYDNAHHLPPGKLEELERLYPKTHAKYRSLILGLRGPNITGPPVYDGAFNRDFHVRVIPYDPSQPLLEGFHAGGKHPTWVAAQRSGMGSFRVLGGVIGKRLFLDSFLPMIDQKREEWFGSMTTSLYCADPPPSSEEGFRFTALTALRGHGYQKVRFRPNGNAPDTRESVIQNIGGLMQRRFGAEQAFGINADPARFLMVSLDVVKPTSYFVDSCEGSYVWDDNLVSVANKKIQQPKYDQWIEGWQRCMENIVLNFCAGPIKKAGPPNPRQLFPQQEPLTGPMGWAS